MSKRNKEITTVMRSSEEILTRLKLVWSFWCRRKVRVFELIFPLLSTLSPFYFTDLSERNPNCLIWVSSLLVLDAFLIICLGVESSFEGAKMSLVNRSAGSYGGDEQRFWRFWFFFVIFLISLLVWLCSWLFCLLGLNLVGSVSLLWFGFSGVFSFVL